MKASCVMSALFFAAVAVSTTLSEEPAAVTRVISLLTELKERIAGDETSEQAVYDKFACWCEEMTQKKAAAIEATRTEIRRLGNQILQLKGTVATTVAEIAQLVTDIKSNEESQKQATSIRQKQNAEFVAEKNELEQASGALEKAIIVIRDATSTSLLRKAVTNKRAPKISSMLQVVHTLMNSLPSTVRPAPKQLVALRTAIAEAKRGKSGYTPQSSTIQGILTDMHATFVASLESRTAEEATAMKNFETLMHTYAQELQTMQETLAKKEKKKTEAETMLADATQGFSDAEEQLKADVKFFDATKASCVTKSDDWGSRKTLRQDQLEGISKAIEILSSDDARATFSTAIKPGFETSFFQLEEQPHTAHSGPVLQACRVLQTLARKGHSVRLASLAAKLRTAAHVHAVGHFDEVITAIDGVIEQLLEEAKDDEKKQSECKDKYQAHSSTQADLDWKIQNNEAKITKLEQLIEKTTKEQTATIASIEDVVKEQADMKTQRESENAEFLQAKTDDEKAIDLLGEAKTALSNYHENHGSLEAAKLFLQREEPSETPPEAKFSKKDNREVESKGIISLLNMIIEDLHSEISNGVKAEESAQVGYEKQVAAAKALEEKLRSKKANLDDVIAKKGVAKSGEEETKTENEGLLTSDKDEETSIKPDCDFTIANIDTRRNKRDTEVAGLREAKSLLAGMDQASLISLSHHFDDTVFPSIGFKTIA